MNTLLQLFDINNTFFTIFNYPMSYIEFFGTLLNLACVWLVARKNIWNWPIGILATVLFGALFYQLHLYADLFEQGYYILTGFWGWLVWTKTRKPKAKNDDIVVKRNSPRANLAWMVGIGIATFIGAWAMARIHLWLPRFFPVPASLPLLDVWTTVMSFAAQILMIQKKVENWILWIVVDVIALWLYTYKGVPFVAMLYGCFLVMAIMGLINWYRTYRRQEDDKGTMHRKVLPTA